MCPTPGAELTLLTPTESEPPLPPTQCHLNFSCCLGSSGQLLPSQPGHLLLTTDMAVEMLWSSAAAWISTDPFRASLPITSDVHTALSYT